MELTYTVEEGYRRYYFYMLWIANKYVQMSAEDVVQEVTISLLKKEREQGPMFESHDNFRRYVTVAIRNAAIDVLKTHNNRRALNVKYLSENWLPDPIEPDSTELKKREEYRNYLEKKFIVERMMEYLPPPELETLRLRWEGRKNPEIAKSMDVKVQSVKNYLQRGIDRIRRFVVDENYRMRLIKLRGKVEKELLNKKGRLK